MPATTVHCEWRGGLQRFYLSDTYETVNVHAPAKFLEEFVGTATLTANTIWTELDVAGGDIARIADAENGVISCVLTGAAEAQDATLHWNDERGINVKDGAIIEMRVRFPVLPTLNAEIVCGVAGVHDLDNDTILEQLWFKLDAATTADLLVAETMDTTNNNDDISTGVTVAIADYYILRIDTTVNTDVKFYVNGAGVATGTTFDISNLSDAEGIMQPYLSVDKPNEASVGSLYIDYFRAWWKRV